MPLFAHSSSTPSLATTAAVGLGLGVGVGIGLGFLLKRGKKAASCFSVGDEAGSGVWDAARFEDTDTAGFTCRAAPKESAAIDVFLEKWTAGSEEPPHSHPGDDMTIVVEGRMQITFFQKDESGKLVQDGEPIILQAGQTGYINANRIHDAKYLEDCKLVYVHNETFGFAAAAGK